MNPAFIYFDEIILKDDNKFTLDFSDKEFIQEVNFINNLDYDITSLNCKLKAKEYIGNKDQRIKELFKKSRLLLEKGPAYQNYIDYLTLKSIWYVKKSNHAYRFMLWPKIIEQYSYIYKFWDTVGKKIRDCKIYSPFSHFIEKGFMFERPTLQGVNLDV